MIGFRVNNEWLDLGNDQRIGIEIKNPLFGNQISGPLTYPISLDLQSKQNRLALGWPDKLAVTDAEESFSDVQLYVENWLYKIGVLKYRGQSNFVSSYNFQSDAGDFSYLTDGVKLRDLALGIEALNLGVTAGNYPTYNYALFPVYNPEFYGKKNTAYLNYQNYYDGVFIANTGAGNKHCLTPFPYLVFLLKRIFELYGYEIIGTWIDEAEVQKLVVHSNYAVDELVGGVNTYTANIDFKNHVPDMTVNAFLVAIKKFFGLGMLFDSKAKTVKIVRLGDVLASDSYVDWTDKVASHYEDVPVDYKGVTLKCVQDSTDKYMEQLGNDWLEYRVANGDEEISVGASSLHIATAVDEIKPARTWTIPQILQSGSSPEFDLGTNYHPLRLMYYKGMVAGYPQGSYVGDTIDLRWDGANGLYLQSHKAWLDFLREGKPINRKVNLNLYDLDKLDPETPILIDYLKFMWTSVRLTVSAKKIEIAEVKFVLKRASP